jgi:uncharacterized protein YydD (DUF2326 family)
MPQHGVGRSKKEKVEMVKDLVLKRKWIIGGVGKSYIGNLADRADLIIILRVSLMRSTYRVFRRYFLRKLKRESDSFRTLLKGYLKNYKWNYSSKGELQMYLNSLIDKYSDKILVLDKKTVGKFLEGLG